jgi:hypothetical protein
LEALEQLYGTLWVQSNKSRFILPEELPGLLHVCPGAPFRYAEVERDFLRALSGEELPVLLLEDDPVYLAERTPKEEEAARRLKKICSQPPGPREWHRWRWWGPVDTSDTPGPHITDQSEEMVFMPDEWEEMVERAKLSLVSEGWFKDEE